MKNLTASDPETHSADMVARGYSSIRSSFSQVP